MGCGTGPLTQQDRFKITLRFSADIDETDSVYTGFRDGVQGILQGLYFDWTPSRPAPGRVDTVVLTIKGPIPTQADAEKFNMALNRLLWGVRVLCPGNRASGYQVAVVRQQKNNEPARDPDWVGEPTCSIEERPS
jgi:hypothetical protein